tara:strand:- start:208 stop:411 length:204 start_codon:yes stop_codon:yes gene_type:complete
MNTAYTLFVKGWGDDEDMYYAISNGNNIDALITEAFEDFEFEAVYYVMDANTLDTVLEGTHLEGVYT